MSLALRRHHTARVIKKRLKIARKGLIPGLIEENQYTREPHRLHKFNMNCGCKMCHMYKHAGNKKSVRLSHRDRKLFQSADEQ